MTQQATRLLVDCLIKQGVEYVFSASSTHKDAVFEALSASPIKLILCRHQQNAISMAAAYERLTGKPGVVLVKEFFTVATAGDPIVAIGEDLNEAQLKILTAADISVSIINAFRIAKRPRSGAVFISFSQNLGLETTDLTAGDPPFPEYLGPAPKRVLDAAANLITHAKNPVLFLGLDAARPENTKTLRSFLRSYPLPVVCTYEGNGVISRDLSDLFAGPVGLFKNQLGDALLDAADLIVTVGFDPAEYDSAIWNAKRNKTILHLDYRPADIQLCYQPALEILGGINENLAKLFERLKAYKFKGQKFESPYRENLKAAIDQHAKDSNLPIHPITFIHALREVTRDETIIAAEFDSNSWLARYFLTVEPHHLLLNNEQHNLGKALPWAMAATLTRPKHKVISISGVEGFLSAADELETALREKMQFVHIVWTQDSLPEHFGVKAYRVNQAADLIPLLTEALAQQGPAILEVPIFFNATE